MATIYSNGGNRWNILGFNFTKRDALSSVYKISMVIFHCVVTFSVATQARAIKLQYQGNTSLYQCLVLLKTHCVAM